MTVRHALITGGSRGIGLSIAHLFAQNSYRCTLLSRNATNLQAAVAGLPTPHLKTSALPHKFIVGDVGDRGFWTPDRIGKQLPSRDKKAETREEVEVAKEKSEGEGRIDVLVNCAGITQSNLFARTFPQEVESVVDTNLTGLILGTRYLLRHRFIFNAKRKVDATNYTVENHSPVIINVASLLGLQGGYGAVVYSASKAGVLGFTRALATEVGRSGIRVNAIVPGYIETDMTAGTSSNTISKHHT